MDQQSVYDVFRLSGADHPGFVHTLPFHPLEHVLSIGDTPEPTLIIRYDSYPNRRVLSDGVPRIKPLCTHTTLTLVTEQAEAPLSFGFGGACFAKTYNGRNFVRINAELKRQADFYDEIDTLPVWKKLRHPSLKLCVTGHLNDESWRYADSCMSVHLTANQVSGALREIEKWNNYPPAYQVLALQGKNCHSFVAAVMRGAGVNPPIWWGWKPWPPLDACLLDKRASRRGLINDGDWVLQSRTVTRALHYKLAKRRTTTGAHDLTDALTSSGSTALGAPMVH